MVASRHIAILKLCRLIYQRCQALSLDVALGAAIFSFAISRYYQVQVPPAAFTCLALATWLIYTCDHLLDARKITGRASTYRHRFHKKYRKPLLLIALLLFITGSVMACSLPKIIFYFGIMGAVLSLAYFVVLNRTLFWQKEICITIGYTWGIFLAPVSLCHGHLSTHQWLLIPQVLLVVLANLLIFSWFDVYKDQRDGHRSMVIHWGITFSENIIALILSTGIVLSVATIVLDHNPSTLVMQSILLLMYGALALIYKQDRLFRANDIYRFIGDGIFFIPLLYIVYAALQ